jgi:hypothetical protein
MRSCCVMFMMGDEWDDIIMFPLTRRSTRRCIEELVIHYIWVTGHLGKGFLRYQNRYYSILFISFDFIIREFPT